MQAIWNTTVSEKKIYEKGLKFDIEFFWIFKYKNLLWNKYNFSIDFIVFLFQFYSNEIYQIKNLKIFIKSIPSNKNFSIYSVLFDNHRNFNTIIIVFKICEIKLFSISEITK